MLACIACSKHVNGSVESSLDEEATSPRSPASRETIKSLTNQLKGIAIRFSAGAVRHCRPCTTAGEGDMMSYNGTPRHIIDSMDILDASSELSVGSSAHNSIGGSNLSSYYSTPAQSFKGTPSRSKRETPTNHIAFMRHNSDSKSSSRRGIDFTGNNGSNKGSNGSINDKSSKKQVQESRKQVQEGRKQVLEGLRNDGSVKLDPDQNELKSECEEENAESEKEWVAQVEPGVLITFVTLLDGGNDLKRIRFSREMFNKWQAQQWWAENCDKVHELYNVPKFSRMPGSLPTPARSEDEGYKSHSSGEYKKPKSYEHSKKQGGGEGKRQGKRGGHARGASMASEVLGATDMSSACASEWEAASEEEAVQHHPRLNQCCSGRTDPQQGGGGGGEQEEWVEEDEPGVYITLTSANGSTELKRIRFSREKFTETQARIWWEENRIRVYEHYL